MGSRIVFPAKYVSETVVLTFDYTSVTNGSVASSPVVTASVFSGVDATPSAIISGAASVDSTGQLVTQKITGGVAGCVYDLSCSVTIAAATSYLMNGYLAVIPSQP